ncbi:uncharacterized protein LY79DRAFT_675344 [Colletotrichum navitas]|uniref:Uncharacterized protein n=1 Tax=Colletotrichum navitas TaxID=681940 RepID=A0AAD8PIW6_9PEZI|nr:uncharacterized protein LY79DRAFT_675344 [Colletotrichum navitas]KAK1561747.1 hypothetical protein LY79DRAFT_675344 [Colletotrichum navitas]
MLELPVINDDIIKAIDDNKGNFISKIVEAYLVARQSYVTTNEEGKLGLTIGTDKIKTAEVMAKEMESMDFD